MNATQKSLVSAVIGSLLSLIGCGQAQPVSVDAGERSIVEEIPVVGFDKEGEPVIKRWSDGSLSIHFEAMPPFFAEDNGTQKQFEQFETKLEAALGVAVTQDDREVFMIKNPKPDTAANAKKWLEAYNQNKPSS